MIFLAVFVVAWWKFLMIKWNIVCDNGKWGMGQASTLLPDTWIGTY